MKKILIVLTVCCLTQLLKAQVSMEYISEKFYRINKVFDSSYFMQFNVKYIYQTDTVHGKFDHYEREGKYIIKGSNFYYNLGDVEVMQNDTFAFTLYHADKTINVEKRTMSGVSNVFPLKQTVDSLLAQYATYYTINVTTDEVDHEQTIWFTTDSLNVPYSSFSITYDFSNYFPEKMEFHFKESYNTLEEPIDDSLALENPPSEPEEHAFRNKTLTILFSDFHPSDTDFGNFAQQKYIYYDPSKRRFIPSDRFKNYMLYVSGLIEGGDNIEENPEVHPQQSN